MRILTSLRSAADPAGLRGPAWIEETAPSFPSGHATMSAVVDLSIVVLLALLEARRLLRIYLLAVGLRPQEGIATRWPGAGPPPRA